MTTEVPAVAAAGAAASPDALHHVQRMCGCLEQARDHLREDIAKVDDPLFRQMFSGASSVLDRLVEAFRTYESMYGWEAGHDRT